MVSLKKLLLVIFLASTSFSQKKVVVYYQGWEYGGSQDPWELEYQYMTHIIHIYGGPTDANASTSPYWNLLSNSSDSVAFFWNGGYNMVTIK